MAAERTFVPRIRTGPRAHRLRLRRRALRPFPARGGADADGGAIRVTESAQYRGSMRRRPPLELRDLRRPRPPPGVGRQRLRRDPPGPWEWDAEASRSELSRSPGATATSPRRRPAAAVLSTVREYREAMREFAAMRNLDVWYARLDVDSPARRSGQGRRPQADEGGAARTWRRPRRRTASRPSIASSTRSTASRGSSAIRRCWFRPASSSPRIRRQALEERIIEMLGRYRESLKGTAATSSTATGSSKWPARWSGSAASGRAPGWC